MARFASEIESKREKKFYIVITSFFLESFNLFYIKKLLFMLSSAPQLPSKTFHLCAEIPV